MQAPSILLNAVPGWGKTTAGAYAPGAVFLLAEGEEGYETLAGKGRVPTVPRALIMNWGELIATIELLNKEPIEGMQTLVLDAMGKFESMLHKFICHRDFNDDFGPKGFFNYHKGYSNAAKEWDVLLKGLQDLKRKGVAILLLCHATTKQLKNPLGEDYDRYIGQVHEKIWDTTHNWCDCVFFGNFMTTVVGEGSAAKGVGGTTRVVYTEFRAGFDAKNRHGMPPMLGVPPDPSRVWSTIADAMFNTGVKQ